MDVALVVESLRKIPVDPRDLPEAIARFQQLVWKEPLTGNSAVLEIVRDLAYDLDYYEPDPRARAGDRSFYGEERAVAGIEAALTRIERVEC